MQTRDEKLIDDIDFAIKATDSQDDYSMGMRNGMRYVKSLIDGKEPQYELRRTDEETKLGLDLGDEVIGDFGAKGIVVGIDTYEGDVVLSLLMRNHKVPQLVKASSYKTKTGRHFPQIVEVLEQMKEDKMQPKKLSWLWECERCGKLIPYMADFCHECADELLGDPPKPFNPPAESEDKE